MLSEPEKLEPITNSYKPVASSYQRFAFHEAKECAIIDNLRAWSYEYFKMFKIYETTTRIPSDKRDFDVQGKIIKAD